MEQPHNKSIPFESSWVRSVSYNAGILTVITKSGRSFGFKGVPPNLWKQLEAAPSKGKFINAHIKGKYEQI